MCSAPRPRWSPVHGAHVSRPTCPPSAPALLVRVILPRPLRGHVGDRGGRLGTELMDRRRAPTVGATARRCPKAGDHEDLRALLNAGHRRGATVPRYVGEGTSMTVQLFPVFPAWPWQGAATCPTRSPDRAVVLRMRRRAKSTWRPARNLIATISRRISPCPPFCTTREAVRSEERRVGKECRSRWSPY